MTTKDMVMVSTDINSIIHLLENLLIEAKKQEQSLNIMEVKYAITYLILNSNLTTFKCNSNLETWKKKNKCETYKLCNTYKGTKFHIQSAILKLIKDDKIILTGLDVKIKNAEEKNDSDFKGAKQILRLIQMKKDMVWREIDEIM